MRLCATPSAKRRSRVLDGPDATNAPLPPDPPSQRGSQYRNPALIADQQAQAGAAAVKLIASPLTGCEESIVHACRHNGGSAVSGVRPSRPLTGPQGAAPTPGN